MPAHEKRPPRRIEYWFSTASPWAWLGSARFAALAKARHASVEVLPIDLSEVFAATGGTPFARRSAARQTYRQLELARWSKRLDVPITLEPRFYPVDRGPSSKMLIAGRQQGLEVLALSHAVLRGIWVEERDIADWTTLVEIAESAGFDGAALATQAQSQATHDIYQGDTQRALAAQVFGSPTYVVQGERFWGQDRLDLLTERLSADD
jgi:2-hydroxychromene-2-carboxylate isomerase